MSLTKEQFLRDNHLDNALVEAVINQLQGWEGFVEDAPLITEHGIDGGYGGFVYYSDTVKFTKENRALILALAKVQAEEMGESSMFAMMAHFRCFKGLDEGEIAEGIYEENSEDYTQVHNGLAWYAGEEVCRAYMDLVERSDD